MKTQSTIKCAAIGSISHGTLKPEDLLSAFLSELEWQLRRNGDYFSSPENFAERDRLNNLIGEAQDCFAEDGQEISEEKIETAEELINDLSDALQTFAMPYFCFGAHWGDGSDFGYWPEDVEQIKECVEFVSSRDQEYPDDDFSGEWLHVNERGNCTLYVRENGQDREVWGIA